MKCHNYVRNLEWIEKCNVKKNKVLMGYLLGKKLWKNKLITGQWSKLFKKYDNFQQPTITFLNNVTIWSHCKWACLVFGLGLTTSSSQTSPSCPGLSPSSRVIKSMSHLARQPYLRLWFFTMQLCLETYQSHIDLYLFSRIST